VTAIIRLRHAAIGYRDHAIVHDLDLELHRGEVMAVLGANGSGKTTLLRGILGLAPVLAGSIQVFDVPVQRFSERYRLGYVPQRQAIGGGIPATVSEVVGSGRLPRKRPFSFMTAQDRHIVRAAIDAVGLSEKASQAVNTLSGGQQRRVLIARALASEPEVLVLDEPTAGVDVANQEILAATLENLVQNGTTVLLVTHELGPLAPLIEHVVILRDGRKTYDGPAMAEAETMDPHPHGEAAHMDHGLFGQAAS
jgi:zinc transport system ATP-binding protein